ncbi:MAG: carbon starvation protein A [Kiritimatiellae bacterium]|jgi:carbon starvation protein|nr:carbon starvation protein A [Kiritimatiellia bacterium]
MNGAVLLAVGIVFYGIAYWLYGRVVERVFGVDYNKETPAVTKNDGVDYVPARPAVLFGHHFASIAGAGPIVGPIMAAHFGWGAVALWVIFGCVFIGAVHDFAALFLSVRHQGRSIGSVIESLMGYWGRILFLGFCWFALILVTAVFAGIVAKTFVAKPQVATASLLFIALALVFGFLVYKRGFDLTRSSFIFVPLMFGCVYIGTLFPFDVVSLFGCSEGGAIKIWTVILLAYCYAASVMPVWLLLQPRDYLNSYLLYVMLAVGVIGIFVAAPSLQMDAFAGLSAIQPKTGAIELLFPMLFVTVACGACSGFHALVSSGTTSKQLSSEKYMRPIAFGGMLVEGILALIALIAVAWMTSSDFAGAVRSGSPVSLFANGLAGFAEKFGLPYDIGVVFVSLALAAFLMTTLDTATRLARFTWQEMFLPRAVSVENTGKALKLTGFRKILTNRFIATFAVVLVSGVLLIGGGTKSIWPIFASCNQLLAALTLLGTTLWLIKSKKKAVMIVIPMLFMLITSGMATAMLFKKNLSDWMHDGFAAGGVLAITAGCLMVMSVILLIFGARRLKESFVKS